MKKIYLVLAILSLAGLSNAQSPAKLQARLDQQAKDIEKKVIEWRRDFHEHPELSNREFNTGKKISEFLKSLGMEVRYPVAKTGVVGILRSGKPGPVIALRADMDALPVVERVDLPFASKVKSTYLGQEVGVMHACGHDTHMAILLGTAEVLSKMKSDLKGTVVFLFQPAEEMAPPGEEGGAALMIKEGVLDDPKVDVAFGLHINSQTPVGEVTFKPEGFLAAADQLNIKVTGRQAHGSAPWSGIDPIVVSAQIINGLQTIVSRQVDITKAGAVVTIGTIKGGVRNNIIPEVVEMSGTIRTLDTEMQKDIHRRIKQTAEKIAESMGAKAEVEILIGYPVTYNSPELTSWAQPVMERVAGKEKARVVKAVTGAEDFSFFSQKVPGFFFFVGGMPPGSDPTKVPSHHTPDFYIDESGMITGLRAMLNLTVDYMYNPLKK